MQCSKKIDLPRIFDGDVEDNMEELRRSIACGESWRRLFTDVKSLIVRRAEARHRADEAAVKAGATFRCVLARAVVGMPSDPMRHRREPLRTWEQIDQSSIFAQVEAFVQRCRDLLEVCEGQKQFARRSKGMTIPKGERAPLPVFGGSRGSDIEKRSAARLSAVPLCRSLLTQHNCAVCTKSKMPSRVTLTDSEQSKTRSWT